MEKVVFIKKKFIAIKERSRKESREESREESWEGWGQQRNGTGKCSENPLEMDNYRQLGNIFRLTGVFLTCCFDQLDAETWE